MVPVTVGNVAAVIVVPVVVVALYQRPRVLPVVKPPAVYVSVPVEAVLIPRIKALAPVLTKPVVKVSVLETVPVLDPDNSELALPNVTPDALLLLIVKLLKLAVGDAVKFLKVPLPVIVCAFGLAAVALLIIVAKVSPVKPV